MIGDDCSFDRHDEGNSSLDEDVTCLPAKVNPIVIPYPLSGAQPHPSGKSVLEYETQIETLNAQSLPFVLQNNGPFVSEIFCCKGDQVCHFKYDCPENLPKDLGFIDMKML